MLSPAYLSREILEAVFSNLSPVDELFKGNDSSPYNNGAFLVSVQKREDETRQSLRDVKTVTNTCSRWHKLGMKFRCETLIIDAKSSETWQHAEETLKNSALGKYVKRLQLEAFDSSHIRVKSAVRILRQCPNVKDLSLTFADDCRKSSPVADLLLYAIRSSSASKLEYLRCDFGKSFQQASILCRMTKFPNLQGLHLHSAYEVDLFFDPQPVEMTGLRRLTLTSTKDMSLGYMSGWALPSFEDLSVLLLHAATAGNRRFFAIHGSKLCSLELHYITEALSTLLRYCTNLEELVLSLDGLAQQRDADYSLFHDTVRRIGIRDMCTNSITAWKTMIVLDKIMRKLTCSIIFPNVREIRLLDFHRSLLVNIAWTGHHAELWRAWSRRCEEMLILLQAADGRQISLGSPRSIRLLHPKLDDPWLSMPKIHV